jgi:ABC-type proline/glycine betaine transport system permease subunit
MQQQITRISPFQTAKVVGVLYFIITIPFIVLFGLVSVFAPGGQRIGLVFAICAPFIYAIVGFIFCIVGAWIYNAVAGLVGGIEYTTTETRDF